MNIGLFIVVTIILIFLGNGLLFSPILAVLILFIIDRVVPAFDNWLRNGK